MQHFCCATCVACDTSPLHGTPPVHRRNPDAVFFCFPPDNPSRPGILQDDCLPHFFPDPYSAFRDGIRSGFSSRSVAAGVNQARNNAWHRMCLIKWRNPWNAARMGLESTPWRREFLRRADNANGVRFLRDYFFRRRPTWEEERRHSWGWRRLCS